MSITNLPKPGIGFKATLGPGSFQRKLSDATRYGGLKNLRDNQKVIVGAIKKYQGVIRTKGGLSRLQQRDAWLKMKASDKNITKEDKIEIKEVLKHLGRSETASARKTAIAGKAIKVGGGKTYLSQEQIKRNLNRARQERISEESESMNRGATYSKQYAGGQVKSHGLIGEMDTDITERNRKIGFASDYKNKLPDSSSSKRPTIGIKPLGL